MRCRCAQTEDMRRWFRGPLIHLSIVYVLYYWGENTWLFALGLYLVHFEQGIFRLVAIFGFAAAGSVLLFGGLLGNWVDKANRLTAMRVAISLQDLAVMASFIIVFFALKFDDDVGVAWSGGLGTLLVSAVVILSIIAQLFGMVFKISLERDWFVVISGGDKALLARINSVTRTLDQICMIVAPLVTGQIMTNISLEMAALIIAGYSLVSVCAKYFLTQAIYKQVPGLSKPKGLQAHGNDEEDITTDKNTKTSSFWSVVAGDPEEEHAYSMASKENEVNPKSMDCPEVDAKCGNSSLEGDTLVDKKVSVKPAANNSCIRSLCTNLSVLCTGWSVYARQKVVLAGVGLSLLYMTVLAFHSITIAYTYANGINEFTVGLLTGLAGVAGIVGSILYPALRKKLGLDRTGIFGFWFEIVCLTLPLISVWLPGSPFDPGYVLSDRHVTDLDPCPQAAVAHAQDGDGPRNGTELGDNSTASNPCGDVSTVTPSIVVFLIGVIISRTGLWIADLTVTQLIQEGVPETERGLVSGVQNSLCMLFEVGKHVLVIILPYVQTFGILVMLSYASVLAGGLCFLAYASKREKEVTSRCHDNRLGSRRSGRCHSIEASDL